MKTKYNSGFTLIEVLIALVVTMIIMGGAYSAFNGYQKQTTIQTNVSDAQQTLRAAMDFMVREVRMAGYDPESDRNTGIEDVSIDAANNSSIEFTFAVDSDGDGNIDGTDRIIYSIADMPISAPDGTFDLAREENGGGRQLMAKSIISLGLAYAYDSNDDGELDRDGSGNVIWAIDDGGNWSQLDLSTGNTSVTGTAVDERTIRAVRIWMLAQSQAPDPNYTDTNTYIVGPHVRVPNNNFRHRLLERTVLCRNMGL
jgi:type IV pilus assembly protein PilW